MNTGKLTEEQKNSISGYFQKNIKKDNEVNKDKLIKETKKFNKEESDASLIDE